MRPPGEQSISTSGHRLREHTADVIVEAWGPTLAACLSEACIGVIETYAESPLPQATVQVGTTIESGDLEALEQLLDELIYLLDTEDDVPVACSVSEEDALLTASIGLAPRARVTPTGSVPKAISKSEMTLDRSDVVFARFIVDV